MPDLKFYEWLIIFLAVYLTIWTFDHFLGSLLSGAFILISGGILLVSYIADFIQPSKVPRTYYRFMWASLIAPILSVLIYVYLFQGQLDWM